MAVIRSYISTQGRAEGLPVHYVVDLTSELPSTGINIGDTAFCKQTNYFMKSQNGATWTNQGGGGGAADFSDLTGTASIAQGGTGASNATEARTALELGTAATSDTDDFAPTVHTHAISDVTSLQTSLDGKSSTSHNHNLLDLSEKSYSSLSGKPTLGALASQDALAFSVITGSVSIGAQSGNVPLAYVSGTLSFASGGTGASNAASARTNLGLGDVSLLNTNASQVNFLRGDGSWITPSAGSVAASDITGSLSLVAQSGLLPLARGVLETLAVMHGGTGAANASVARTNLGLGSLATLSSVTLVTDTTGTLSVAQGGTGASSGSAAYTNLGTMGASNLSGTVAIVNGGTGQSNVSSAINALLPSQSGNSGKYLTTDATNISWGTVVGGSPFTTVRKTGLDQGTGVSTPLTVVDQLQFSLAANTNYVYEFWVRYQTAATTTGIQLGIETPASPVGNWMSWTTPLAAAGTLTGGSSSGSNTTLSIGSGVVSTAAAGQVAYLTGMVMNGANAGTMQLKFCSEVSGSRTTIKTGSMGRIMSVT